MTKLSFSGICHWVFPWDFSILMSLVEDMGKALEASFPSSEFVDDRYFFVFADGRGFPTIRQWLTVENCLRGILSFRHGLPVRLKLPGFVNEVRFDTKLHSRRGHQKGNFLAFLSLQGQTLVYKARFGEGNLRGETTTQLALSASEVVDFTFPRVVANCGSHSWILMTRIEFGAWIRKKDREKLFVEKILPVWHSTFGFEIVRSRRWFLVSEDLAETGSKAKGRFEASEPLLQGESGIHGTVYGSAISRGNLFYAKDGTLALIDFEKTRKGDISIDLIPLLPKRYSQVAAFYMDLLEPHKNSS